MDISKLPHLPKLRCEESAICLWLLNDGFVFQAAHAITDGAGLTQLIRTFFQVLRSIDTTNGELSAVETRTPVNNCDIDERTFANRFVANFKGFMPRWDKKFTNPHTENQKAESLEALLGTSTAFHPKSTAIPRYQGVIGPYHPEGDAMDAGAPPQ